ncbi:hypothetical protein pipiens_000721, partial [Culex pipiens pipiens]
MLDPSANDMFEQGNYRRRRTRRQRSAKMILNGHFHQAGPQFGRRRIKPLSLDVAAAVVPRGQFRPTDDFITWAPSWPGPAVTVSVDELFTGGAVRSFSRRRTGSQIVNLRSYVPFELFPNGRVLAVVVGAVGNPVETIYDNGVPELLLADLCYNHEKTETLLCQKVR